MPLRGTTTADGITSPIEEVVEMVTYETLFAYTMVLIAVITLVLDLTNRHK